MKKIYLLSWPAGMFGHFMIANISKDPNYYPEIPKMTDRVNTHNSYDSCSILENLEVWPDMDDDYVIPPFLSDEKKRLVDIHYSEKNVCSRILHRHTNHPINLNRLQRVRLFASDQKDLLFCLLMKTIKTYSLYVPAWNHVWWEENIPIKTKNPEMLPVQLEDVSKLSFLDVDMSYSGDKTITEHITRLYNHYVNEEGSAPNRFDDWIYLNSCELMHNPEKEMPVWKEKLDLANDFNFDELKAYYQRNVDLIQREYGKSFEEIASGNFIQDMIDYCERYTIFYKK